MGKPRVTVIVRNGDINKALKIFKKKVMDSGHLLELRERKEYTKPKTVRRTIKLKAIRENQRQLMLERMSTGEYLVGKKHKK
jgi:ribosomal protein S21